MLFINNSSIKDPVIRSLSLLNESAVSAFLDQICQTQTPVSVGFVNQYAYNLCNQSEKIAENFNALTYRLRDGSGINLACRYNACNPGANLNGTDFIPLLVEHVLASHDDADFYVFGTEEPWLSKGSKQLLSGNSCVRINGFEEDSVYLDALCAPQRKSSIRIVILAMGMPKQERIAKKIVSALDGPVVVVCGGAIIDFCAGRFSRAPKFFRRLGMEWSYRLGLEPIRLFNRYVVGAPLFFFYVLKNKLSGKSLNENR